MGRREDIYGMNLLTNNSMNQHNGFCESVWRFLTPQSMCYKEGSVKQFPEISESIHLEELWVLAHLHSVLKLFVRIQNTT